MPTSQRYAVNRAKQGFGRTADQPMAEHQTYGKSDAGTARRVCIPHGRAIRRRTDARKHLTRHDGIRGGSDDG